MEERICELEELEEALQKVWEESRVLLEEELEILMLQRELEQAERWLSSYESSLMVQDGVSPDPGATLIRAHPSKDKNITTHVCSPASCSSLCQMFWSS